MPEAVAQAAVAALVRDLLNAASWEERHGGLLAASCPEVAGRFSDADNDFVADYAATLLFDNGKPRPRVFPGRRRGVHPSRPESRVRLQAGVAIAKLCGRVGAELFVRRCQGAIMESIRDNLTREEKPGAPGITVEYDAGDGYSSGEDSGRETPVSGRLSPSGMLHQSAGWRTLETGCMSVPALAEPRAPSPADPGVSPLWWRRALLEVVRALQERFCPFINDDLLGIILVSLRHVNRFVRETSCVLLAARGVSLSGPLVGSP